MPWLERVFVTFALIVRDWSRDCVRGRQSASLPYVGAELVQSQDVSVNVPPLHFLSQESNFGAFLVTKSLFSN